MQQHIDLSDVLTNVEQSYNPACKLYFLTYLKECDAQVLNPFLFEFESLSGSRILVGYADARESFTVSCYTDDYSNSYRIVEDDFKYLAYMLSEALPLSDII